MYLLPFQMVVREANPWCMMTAYNKVNGHHCDDSKELLIDIARGEWKWDGLFMSDWGGTSSSVSSINNGLNLEMPGPPRWRSLEALRKPLADGAVDLTRVDESAGRMLSLLEKTGSFGSSPDEPEYTSNDPAIGAVLLEAASDGIVLLKNEANALPIKPWEQCVSKLAVVGPYAKRVVAGGGGSSYIKAPYWTSVHDSVKRDFAEHGTEVLFHEGAKMNRYLPVPSETIRNPETGVSGACLDWYLGHDFSSKVVATAHV